MRPILTLHLLLKGAICLLIWGGRPGSARAQGPTIVYGEPRTEDFDLRNVPFDSGANAVVIADIGSTRIDNTSRSFCSLRFTRFTRVKILNKNGFDIAWVSLFANRRFLGPTEKLIELKGVTYNRENGVVTRHELATSEIYDSKVGGSMALKSFTMPDLKEGSVYDLSYTISTDEFTNLREWNFQGQYPCLWSEYSVAVPPVLHYMMRETGGGDYAVNEQHEHFERFTFRPFAASSDRVSFAGNCLYQRWAKSNVPSIKNEIFVSNPRNFSSTLRFQLQYMKFDNGLYIEQFSNWPRTCSELMESKQFGWEVKEVNLWMNSELKSITGAAKLDIDKARLIYSFIRDHFSSVPNGSLLLTRKLKDIFHSRSGSEAEINLLLVAMLRHIGLEAYPVMLSTRSNGFPQTIYPIMSEFNYVAAALLSSNKTLLLDASSPCIGFGKLLNECYNAKGRLIDPEKPVLIDLSADSLRETETTTVFIENDDKHFISGFCNQVLGDASSESVRREIRTGTTADYLKKIKSASSPDMTIANLGIDSLNQNEFPVAVHFDFDFDSEQAQAPDIFYFSPVLVRKYGKNPFIAQARTYPVEMPYCVNDAYILSMDVPRGYSVDEMPAPARIELDGNEGFFEYMIEHSGDRIELRAILKLNRAHFPVEEYNVLRDFYARVVKKENEQIVFKKNK